MKCVILAGGKGVRLSELTKSIPKPMVKVGSKPIIEHIIKFYIQYGIEDFLIAGGYKYSIIKNYFKKKKISANINVIDTGLETLTGKRLVKLKKYLNNTFMLTYGDGLTNINLNSLLKFHKRNKKKITVTAVHPPARFGEMEIKNNLVKKFEEKPQLQKGWINGGYFVVEPDFLELIGNKNIMLERSPMLEAVKTKNLAAFKHNGFWFCMDTLRDKKVLDTMIKNKKIPWIK